MDEIKLAITSPNNFTYKRIVLRKFFYMIFIDANGKKLYAYIATVFGGLTKEIDDLDKACKEIENVPGEDCTLTFEIVENDDVVEKVNINDITDSFFQQTQYIEKVWGKCEVLDDQTKVNAALKKLYPDLYKDSKHTNISVSNNTIIQITEEKNNQPSHSCIVTKGIFTSGTASNSYKLSCPSPNTGGCYDGIEAMNWVKVVIDLKRNVVEKPFLFSILLGKDKIFTPDFTWYFAPPPGTVISADSYVKIGGVRVNNVIQRVADETTVYFSEWSDPPEYISERKKSRVYFKSDEIQKTVTNYDYHNLSKRESVSVTLILDNPQKPSNKQFLAGLFIAFLLSFCSDKTRINDFYTCLNINCTCGNSVCMCQKICNAITIFAPILLILCFFSFILTPKKALPLIGKTSGKRFLKACRVIGLISTLVLMVYVYILWLIFPEIMRIKISCNINKWILISGASISLISNLIYIIYCTVILKRKLFNYI